MDFQLKGNIIEVVTHTNHEYLARITNCINEIVYVDAYIYQDELYVLHTSTVLCTCEDIKIIEDANDLQIAYFQSLLLEKHIIYNPVTRKCYDLRKFPPYFYDKATESAFITGNNIYGYTEIVNLTDNTIQNAKDYGYVDFDKLIPAKKDTQVYNYIQHKIMDIKANIKPKNGKPLIAKYRFPIDDEILNYDVNIEDRNPVNSPHEEQIQVIADHPVFEELKQRFDKLAAELKNNMFIHENYFDHFNQAKPEMKNFKLGDIIYVRNTEEATWDKRFFACYDNNSLGEKLIKTTDGKFWKFYKN